MERVVDSVNPYENGINLIIKANDYGTLETIT